MQCPQTFLPHPRRPPKTGKRDGAPSPDMSIMAAISSATIGAILAQAAREIARRLREASARRALAQDAETLAAAIEERKP